MKINKNIPRRTFIRNTSIATAGFTIFQLPAWAKDILLSPVLAPPIHNIPADKKLDAAWIKSLYQRGKTTTYLKSKNELRYIGMPAGGLHAGTVYVGGDGRMWLWGIYNDTEEGIDPKTVLWNDGSQNVKVRSRDGSAYVEPAIAANKRLLEQGFAVAIQYNGKTIIKELKEADWDEIIFEAAYPVATITYIDKQLPVTIKMRVSAIFIPLDADDSALPATVFSIDIQNTSKQEIDMAVCGWMENGAHKITAKEEDGMRRNRTIKKENYQAVFSDFKANNPEAFKLRDAGTTCIACLGKDAVVNTHTNPWPVQADVFTQKNEADAAQSAANKLVAGITSHQHIPPSKSATANYIISWHFDHPLEKRLAKLPVGRNAI